MDLLRRHGLVTALIGILVVALLGWQLLSDDPRPTEPTDRQVTATSPRIEERPSPAPSSDVSIPADEPSDAVGGALRGRAFDAITNEPVPKFEVTWREPVGEPRQQFESRQRTFQSSDGRFEFTDIPPGKWSLIVTARGYQRFELPVIKVTGGAAQEVMLPLQKGHALRGRVYDQATGAGIAATIDVLDPMAPMALRTPVHGIEKVAVEDGNFVIEGLPPGRTSLAVAAKNYASRTVAVEVGANTPPVEIGLSAAGAKIMGMFSTTAGDPIAGGGVSLHRSDGEFVAASQTDAAGAFEFRNLDAARYQVTGRRGSGSVTEHVTLSGGIANVQLTLESGRTIRGTVTGLRPELLPKVNITVRRDGEVVWTPNDVNQRGEFELNNVAPGPLRVVADVNRTREVSKSIEMPANADVTVTLDFPPGASLVGRVTRNNEPLPDLPVIARPTKPGNSTGWDHQKTSSTGSYSVQDLEPGEYVVIAGSFVSKPLQVQGQTVFDIDLPGGDLTGRVLDDSSSVPLAGASVDLYVADAGPASLRINRLSDHLGQFTIAGVVPTEYMLSVYRPGYRIYRERMSFDAQSEPMTIRLRQDRGVEVRGRDAATGRPVREIMVIESVAGQNGFSLTLPLDESGVGYLPSGLAGSKLQLIAAGVGYVEIPSWNGSSLDLRFGTANKQ